MKTKIVIILTLMFWLSFSGFVYAQGKGSGGSSGGSSGGAIQVGGSGQGLQGGAVVNTTSVVTPSSGTQDQIRLQDRDQIRDPSTHDGTVPIQDRDMTQTRDRLYLNSTTSTTTSTTTAGDQLQDRDRIRDRDMIHINPESVPVPAGSVLQLRQMIQTRSGQLDQEVATSTASEQETIKNQNRVRLAVNTMLSAQTLLGGIGLQVSNIAKQIDNSLQVTVNAEDRIQNRSALARIFMGGDSANANAIKQEVEQNQTRIQQLTQLINQANVSSDVKTVLQAQIQNMTAEQTRLQNLANQQLGQWGIFSWRF